MIYSDLTQVNELLPYLSLRLGKALAYLRDTDFGGFADGEYPVEGVDIIARVSSYLTEEIAEKKPESHLKYIDIQYIVQGEENIGYCALTDAAVVSENYAREQDLLFYASAPKERFITVSAGEFVILFPWEVHRPGCTSGETPKTVKKVVIKVLRDG